MTDFDDVLERLLSDPEFGSALASDPDSALAGYHLDPDERELLNAQLVTDGGIDHAVEARATQSSMFGLVGPVVSAFGVAAGPSGAGAVGPAPSAESFGAAPSDHGSFGVAADGGSEAFGTSSGSHQSMGTAEHISSMGAAPLEEARGYRTWVDADGDGLWDTHRVYERADGGVDIHVDLNHDGVAEFVGHDYDRDGLVDTVDYDGNHDGVMDTRMYDDSGDGWMDRQEPITGPG